jgi:hypothetical protein
MEVVMPSDAAIYSCPDGGAASFPQKRASPRRSISRERTRRVPAALAVAPRERRRETMRGMAWRRRLDPIRTSASERVAAER